VPALSDPGPGLGGAGQEALGNTLLLQAVATLSVPESTIGTFVWTYVWIALGAALQLATGFASLHEVAPRTIAHRAPIRAALSTV